VNHQKAIALDFSTLSTFQDCHERSRFGYVEHLQPLEERAPLSFGTAFHAGVAAFYKNVVKMSRSDAVRNAKRAFVAELRRINSALPISIESDEKRSVERGIAMLEAYLGVWKDEPYRNAVRPDTGEPYVEIGFSVYLMEWRGVPVVIVGRIDRVMESMSDGYLYNFELKSTAQGLNQFKKQVRPNHQISIYHWAAKELIKRSIHGTIWDCAFVSDRKPTEYDPKDEWMIYGVSRKDFAREETRRSSVDIEEMLYDMEMTATSFLNLRASGLRRWERNAPNACYKYGGCPYLDICSTNINPDVVRSKYKVEEWKPWEGILPPHEVVNWNELYQLV